MVYEACPSMAFDVGRCSIRTMGLTKLHNILASDR